MAPLDPNSPLIARGVAGLASLARRDYTESEDSTMNLLLSLLGVAFVALLLTALLMLLRRMKLQQRMAEDETLPPYSDLKHGGYQPQYPGNARRLTIQTPDGRSSILVVNDRPMLSDPAAPPHSPNNVPQIHITFPDEQDEFGKQKSGRVMLVRVGETSVGLEPVQDEQLPAYEKESKGGFYSIDMDQIGGLKEKNNKEFQ